MVNKQQIKGATNEATGKVKKSVGKAMDDRTLQAKGLAREAKGKAQEKLGNAKQDVKERQATKDAAHRDRDLDR